MKTKITDVQKHWLEILANHGGYSPMKKEASATLASLMKKGLAEHSIHQHRYFVTEAGRRLLLEMEPFPPAISREALEEVKRSLTATESNQLRSIAECEAYAEALRWAGLMGIYLDNSKGLKR